MYTCVSRTQPLCSYVINMLLMCYYLENTFHVLLNMSIKPNTIKQSLGNAAEKRKLRYVLQDR